MYLICAHIFGFTTVFQFVRRPIVTCLFSSCLILLHFFSLSLSLFMCVFVTLCIIALFTFKHECNRIFNPVKWQHYIHLAFIVNKERIFVSPPLINNFTLSHHDTRRRENSGRLHSCTETNAVCNMQRKRFYFAPYFDWIWIESSFVLLGLMLEQIKFFFSFDEEIWEFKKWTEFFRI